MHKEYILLNGFRKAKRGFTAGFHVPLIILLSTETRPVPKLTCSKTVIITSNEFSWCVSKSYGPRVITIDGHITNDHICDYGVALYCRRLICLLLHIIIEL